MLNIFPELFQVPLWLQRPWRHRRPKRTHHALCFLALILVSACAAVDHDPSWELIERYPHDTDSFTQGLELMGERIYESSGRYGKSWVEYRPAPDRTGAAARDPSTWHRRTLPQEWFAEGLTLFNNELYVLTWRAGRALVLDPDTLATRRIHRYSGEGWGLTNDGYQLIMSDGSSTLRFINPENFEVRRQLTVTEQGQPLNQLNELEWAEGWILANLWLSDDVVVIDPETGVVAQRLRLAALYPRHQRGPGVDVLNGLAWDAEDGSLLLTGKLWPELYRLRVSLPERSSHARQENRSPSALPLQ